MASSLDRDTITQTLLNSHICQREVNSKKSLGSAAVSEFKT